MRLPRVLKAGGRIVPVTDEEAHRLRKGKFPPPRPGSFPRKRRGRWEEWEILALRVMARHGKSPEEIAEALGRPVSSVRRKIKEVGL